VLANGHEKSIYTQCVAQGVCCAIVRRKETTLALKSDVARSTEARARADASFKKEERAKDGAKAMLEYLANERMVRERTERLRALRLAREAAENKAGDKKPEASGKIATGNKVMAGKRVAAKV
jgi:hypothetical protein